MAAGNSTSIFPRIRSGTALRTFEPFVLMVVTCIVLGLLAGCGKKESSASPGCLRISLLPDRSPEKLQHRFDRLLPYLSAQLGMPCKLSVARDYEDLVDQFARGNSELAYFGGFTFTRAQQVCRAVPLVMRQEDRRFTSVFLAAAANKRDSLRAYRGARLAFGDRLSTSGHLMARQFMRGQGIEAESFFSQVIYSGSHDQTVRLVRDGKADLGAANPEVVEEMIRSGELKPDEITVVGETPPFVDSVWAVPAALPAELRRRIRDAFLELSKSDPARAAILDDQETEGFLPAAAADFENLADAVRSSPALAGSESLRP